jgi:hypothetical protein
MTPAPACVREHEVVREVLSGRGPLDGELQAHARQCATCREVMDLADLLRDDRDAVRDRASVPSAGQVWWRAAIRARLEGGQAASRPLDWMFGTAGACAVGLGAAAVAMLWPLLQGVFSPARLNAWLSSVDLSSVDLSAVIAIVAPVARVGGLLALGALACVVLASLAFYFALSDD